MAGLTLGGGYGPLNGRFGLALDNLLMRAANAHFDSAGMFSAIPLPGSAED
jgi:hypothetical protein